MKTSIIVSAVSVFCIWQNINSQLLHMEDKISYAPPYDNTINKVSSEVEKWMNEELSKSYDPKFIEMKTDVKGRTKDVGLSASATKYRSVAVPKQKRKVIISDMHINEVEIEPVYASLICYTAERCIYAYNGKEVTEKEYVSVMDERNKKLNNQKKGKRNLPIPGVISSGDDRNWIALMTAEEISELMKNYKELAIEDYMEPVPFANIGDILDRLWLSAGNGAFINGYKGNGIGIYVMEPGCRDTRIPIVNIYKYSNHCVGGNSVYGFHHSWVVNALQYAAPLAHIYGFSTDGAYSDPSSYSPHPSNPSSYNPPMVIGTHSYGFLTKDGTYIIPDAAMDNYIYEHGVINFVAAGNKDSKYINSSSDTTSFVTSPGKALNAITVGAVEPATMNYAWYSKWKNPYVRNNKPEVGMYTDLYMGSYSSGYNGNYNSNYIFDGTSASTPLLAGLVADYLQTPYSPYTYSYFKCTCPELIKAASLNAGSKYAVIGNGTSFDADNYYISGRQVSNWDGYAWAFGMRFWHGYNYSFFDSNNEINFTENSVPIVPGRLHRMAISWLSTGSYVYNNNIIPQDIDLFVYQDGKLLDVSASAYNPYEAVEFIPSSNSPLVVKIKRYRNSSTNEMVKLGYHFKWEIL